MATKEDLEKAEDEAAEKDADESEEEEAKPEEGSAKAEVQGGEPAADEGGPLQLGYKRYVYAAYMAGAMLVAFLAAKIGHAAWHRLAQWKPELGEPTDEYLYVGAAVVGIGTALYYWRKPESRQYANEVAEELSKVTWPSRKEVTNSTTVVIVTTLFATLFFALMDRFWGYITDQIYSF
jgi:preprotein translocase subunit SecE